MITSQTISLGLRSALVLRSYPPEVDVGEATELGNGSPHSVADQQERENVL